MKCPITNCKVSKIRLYHMLRRWWCNQGWTGCYLEGALWPVQNVGFKITELLLTQDTTYEYLIRGFTVDDFNDDNAVHFNFHLEWYYISLICEFL